jgi:hypothetical protein
MNLKIIHLKLSSLRSKLKKIVIKPVIPPTPEAEIRNNKNKGWQKGSSGRVPN